MVEDGTGKKYNQSSEEDSVARMVSIMNGDFLVIGSYARKGHYEDKICHAARISRNGEIPFIFRMNANASKQKV